MITKDSYICDRCEQEFKFEDAYDEFASGLYQVLNITSLMVGMESMMVKICAVVVGIIIK